MINVRYLECRNSLQEIKQRPAILIGKISVPPSCRVPAGGGDPCGLLARPVFHHPLGSPISLTSAADSVRLLSPARTPPWPTDGLSRGNPLGQPAREYVSRPVNQLRYQWTFATGKRWGFTQIWSDENQISCLAACVIDNPFDASAV